MTGRTRAVLAAVLLAAIVTSCSDSPDAEPAPTTPTIQVNTTTPAAVQSSQTPLVTMPEVTWYGRTYAAKYAGCAQRLWDGRVGQWNALSQAERDRAAGGQPAWFKAKGWPDTHEATLRAPATRKACPA